MVKVHTKTCTMGLLNALNSHGLDVELVWMRTVADNRTVSILPKGECSLLKVPCAFNYAVLVYLSAHVSSPRKDMNGSPSPPPA